MKKKRMLQLMGAAAVFAMQAHLVNAAPTISQVGQFVTSMSGSPSVAVDGNYAYVVFTDKNDSYKGKVRRYDLTTHASVVSGQLFDTIGETDSSHNGSAIAVDGDGYIHVMIGMHNHYMKYYKSTAPGAYNSFTDLSSSMPGYTDTGIDQKRYTYPSARTASNGDVVFVLRRTGIDDRLRESWYFEKQDLYHYDVSEGQWNLIWIKGKADDGGGNYRDAYMSRIHADEDNNVHVVTAWAKQHSGNNTFQRATYLKFDLDTGTFHKADGTDVTANLPIYVDDTDGSVDFCFNSGVPWGDNTTEIQTPHVTVNDLGHPVVSFGRNWEPSLSKDNPEDELSVSTWNGSTWVLTDRLEEIKTRERAPITNTGGMINTYSRNNSNTRHIISSDDHGLTWPISYNTGGTSWMPQVIELDSRTDLMIAGTRLYKVIYPAYATYAIWAADSGLDGSPGKEDGLGDNPDSDDLDNQSEYAMGGDPLDPNDPAGVVPTYQVVDIAGTDYFQYVYNRRTDAGVRSLTYEVPNTDDLISGAKGSDVQEVGTSAPFTDALGDVFESVTNQISTVGRTNVFTRLEVTIDE